MTEPAVTVERLQKTLGKKEVLHGISFIAGKGEIFGLLGPNGAGKTTTLRLICTLLAPDAGSINVLGFDIRMPWRSWLYRLNISITAAHQNRFRISPLVF